MSVTFPQTLKTKYFKFVNLPSFKSMLRLLTVYKIDMDCVLFIYSFDIANKLKFLVPLYICTNIFPFLYF
jgi:hypothetical protein